MIQFNLLPDIKLDYIKAQRSKKLVLLVASGVAAVALAIFLVMAAQVYLVQRKTLNDLGKSIDKSTKEIQSTNDVDKILTVQNQLNTLADIHGTKPVTSRLFGYLSQLTPIQVKIGSLAMDFGDNTMTFSGTADSLQTINKFADTLKFTTFKAEGETDETKAFKSVVLESFARDDKVASYTLKIEFEPALYNSDKKVTLIVPSQYTTRSITEEPNAGIFDGNIIPKKTGGTN